MRSTFLALAFLLAAAAPAAAAPKSCPIEKAVYRLNGYEESATLRFVNDPKLSRQTPLSAVLKSNVTGREYKFTIAISNGYSTHYLVSADTKRDPEQEDSENQPPSYSFFVFNKALTKIDLPGLQAAAPDYVFIPDIGTSLWYAEQLPNQKNREAIETQMWKRAECAKK